MIGYQCICFFIVDLKSIMKFHLLYLDPGSGSYLIQVIIAAVVGAGFFFKNGWVRIKSFFSKSKPGQEEEKDKVE